MDQFAMLDPFFQRLLSEQNASNDLYSSVASVYAPQDEHRELQSMLNVDNLQISDELKNAMKNITRACLTLAVQCGKQHDVLRALPGGGLKRVFPIRRLFRDPLQITFDMPWDQMMATFEFGDERSKPSSETSLNLPNSTKVHSAQRQEELSGVAAQSLSSEPHTISGHRYRQTSGSSIPISKTKASATSSEEIQRTSGLRGTDARVPRDEAKGNAPTYIVNGKQMKLIHRIFDGDDGRVGSVRWFDLDKLMKRLGFRVELRTGSIVTWIPPLGQGRPMNVHRPHPECSMGPKSTVNLAKRLMQRSSKKALRCATGVPAMELRRIRMPRTKPELPGRTDSKGDDIK
ncbi:hypothetical protein BD324DRAFT_354509 [Kockovaella imperatae]|uniref:Uncharacterized protein n=1 Tax=Kockovaella imperatae TaxID=4999 RepID=A0A1Y1UMP5_9TREE|nr:hypothetical protein BD324DRAFT_354509 [Kockovaella imperatae]ORX38405.1 hypothetical protein BD324DRAFT_354509 [Kockovaella imperatae]